MHLMEESLRHMTEDRFQDVCFWRGLQIKQHPCDLIALQMFLHETQPEAIVECGTRTGGSAVFFRDIMQAWVRPYVVTIDINQTMEGGEGIWTYQSDSASHDVFDRVMKQLNACARSRVFVFLDSDHSREHVLKELRLWSQAIEHGHLLCGDTIVDDRPGRHSTGPRAALNEFLHEHQEYERIDWTPFPLSWFPDGMIRRR